MAKIEATAKGVLFNSRADYLDVLAPNGKIEDFGSIGAESLAKDLGIPTEDAFKAFYAMKNQYNAERATMDSATPTVLSGATVTPAQFTQYWVAEQVVAMIRKMTAIDNMGVETGGDITTSQIVQTILENVGNAYAHNPESSTISLASFNANYESRDVQILEAGLNIDSTVSAMLSMARLPDAELKRRSVALAHASTQNMIAYNGISGKKIYGLLNDPNLPAYTTVKNGASGSGLWSTKTANEIWDDIVAMVAKLLLQSGSEVNAADMDTMLVLPSSAFPYLSQTTSYFNRNVLEQLKFTYPQMQVKLSPEFVGANGANNVAYLKTEDSQFRTGSLHTPIVLQIANSCPTIRGFEENWLSNTAGYFCVRPLTVVRVQGL